jgi:hypothetical protein
MLKECIEKILSLAPVETLKFGERSYTSKQLHAVGEPAVSKFEIHTLSGLVDYVKAAKDFDVKDLLLHVEDHESVRLLSKVRSQWRDREHFVSVTRALHGAGFEFGRFHDAEEFNIGLQSKFCSDLDRPTVLAVVGNAKGGSTTAASDDGVAQSVTVSAGITLVDTAKVPNPVILRPYRTFLEVEQPESAFVLRARQSKVDAMPQFALFEADGGKWKLTAIQRIAKYLKDALPEVHVVA